MKSTISVRRIALSWGPMVWMGWVMLTLGGCKPRDITRQTPYMQSNPATWVRVLLANETSDCTLTCEQPLEVLTSSGILLTRIPGEQEAHFHLVEGSLALNQESLRVTDLRIKPQAPHVLAVDGKPYRGQVRLLAESGQGGFDVINHLPLEPYLAGVIGAEMPPYWEPEALKAQAMVARTYCLYTQRRFGQNRSWDLSRTQAHQVYQGVEGESASVWDAVRQTDGQILEMPDHDGRLQVFPTYYSAVCGGHTEAVAKIFGDDAGPAQGVPCSYCEHVALMNQYLWPLARYSKQEVDQRLKARYSSLDRLGTIVKIEPIEQSDYDGYARITRVRVTGDNGLSDTLRAEDLRLAIDSSGRKIKSCIFRIEDWQDQWAFVAGRGWGHGGGMCQCGAQGMAREGARAEAILHHYFPHAVVKKIAP